MSQDTLCACVQPLQTLLLSGWRKLLLPCPAISLIDTCVAAAIVGFVCCIVLLGPQLPSLSTLGLDRCFARDLGPLCAATQLENLYLSYDCWAIVGVTFPTHLPALTKLRLMAAVQVGGPHATHQSKCWLTLRDTA